jgi:hypothetical protein
MTCPTVPSAKPLTLAVAMVGRAIGACFPRTSKPACGSAQALTASLPQRCDGATLLTQRLILQAAARDARNRGQCRKARLICDELRALTTDILRRGHGES